MRYVFICFVALICVALVLFGSASMQGAAKGFELFISSVFPALFPFFVCISALKRANAFVVGNGSFAGVVLRIFAVSCVSGSPSGSMLTDAAFGGDSPILSHRERSELCAITNLASPVFIVGTVCSRMLGEARYAPLIAVCHYGAAFLLAAAFILKNRAHVKPAQRQNVVTAAPVKISSILSSAIRDSVSTILQVGGTLIFFMTIIGIFDSITAPVKLDPCLRGALCGMLEMTNGIGSIASVQAPPMLRCTLISAILSFGGLCVYMQASGTASIRATSYLKVKLIHAVLAGALCYALFPLFTANIAPVFGIIGDSLAVSRAVTMGEIAICGALASIIASLLAIFTAKRTRA